MTAPDGGTRAVGGPGVRFDGRVVVVTGAGRGLGRAYAELLAARGAAVVVNDIGVSADADRYRSRAVRQVGGDPAAAGVAAEVARAIEAAGGRAVANAADVASDEGARSLVGDALDAFGRIDAVINNAAVVPYAGIEETTAADLRSALDVSVGGTFTVSKAAWPHLKAQGRGRILNICSIEGVLGGSTGFAAYGAAKGGVAGLTHVLAAEGAVHGIGVNGLLPGATTRANASVTPRGTTSTVPRAPEMVAPAAAWLVHEECDVSGKFFAVAAGSMRSVHTSAATGYQHPDPNAFSIEAVRDSWERIVSRDDSMVPDTLAAYNEFRMAVYHRYVPG